MVYILCSTKFTNNNNKIFNIPYYNFHIGNWFAQNTFIGLWQTFVTETTYGCNWWVSVAPTWVLADSFVYNKGCVQREAKEDGCYVKNF